MKTILLSLLVFILTGCLVQPGNPAEELIATEFPVELRNTQIPAASPTQEISDPAPSPTAQISQGNKGEYDHLTLLELAVRDLALRLSLELDDIVVISIQKVTWPDSGLGCPIPDLIYAQESTPGYKILLEAEGKTYAYHSNTSLAFWLCLDGTPQLPLIPVAPGEIDDGIPWMPVDPVPTLADEIIIADPDPVK